MRIESRMRRSSAGDENSYISAGVGNGPGGAGGGLGGGGGSGGGGLGCGGSEGGSGVEAAFGGSPLFCCSSLRSATGPRVIHFVAHQTPSRSVASLSVPAAIAAIMRHNASAPAF